MTYTIKEIINLIERVQESMGECDFMVYPSPVRALDVGALLTVARENIELQAKIEAALAIDAAKLEYPMEQYAANDMRDKFRMVLRSE